MEGRLCRFRHGHDGAVHRAVAVERERKSAESRGWLFSGPHRPGPPDRYHNAGVGETLTLTKNQLQQIKEKVEQAMKQIPAFKNMQNQIKMTITAEGLRIDLLETKRGMFFETGDPKPTEAGGELLKVLANELSKLPNKIVIEGHTDSTPFGRPDYSNWELSADRANAARRILTESGLSTPDQPGPWIRRPAPAAEKRPHESIQPPHLDHCPQSGPGRAGRKDRRTERRPKPLSPKAGKWLRPKLRSRPRQ